MHILISFRLANRSHATIVFSFSSNFCFVISQLSICDASNDIKRELSYAQIQSVIELCSITLILGYISISAILINNFQDEINLCFIVVSYYHSPLYCAIGISETRHRGKKLYLPWERMYWCVMWREKLLVLSCMCCSIEIIESSWIFSLWYNCVLCLHSFYRKD